MRVLIILFVLCARNCLAVIYSLNESDYNRMPALYALDDYPSCLLEPGGTYCLVDVGLYSDGRSDLMRMVQEYSAHTMKHFNHTEIHRGVCVTTTCKSFIQNRNINIEGDLSATLEECLNDTLWRNYKINGKLTNVNYCKREGEQISFETSDIIVAVVYLVLIVINVVGSFYDIILCKDNEKSGNPYVLAFSIKRNWAKLVAPSGGGPEPRLERLKLFHGLRTMTMVCVFFSHTVLVMSHSYVDNPLYIEKSYEDPLKQLLFNGSLVIQTFFVMSSFLLAYNLQLHAEKQEIDWLQWPKGVLLRWLRLTPTYALILATITTLMRYAGSGPMWDLVVGSEAEACRKYWWAHILYINNYVYDDALCLPQTWYLAADTQLFCLGLLVCVVVRGSRARKVALAVLFVLAILIPAAHTYFQDLSALVMHTPEAYRNLYAKEDTFRLVYVRGHTNISTYIIGIAGGLLTYHWQKEGMDFKKYKHFRIVYWLLFPMGVGVILSGGLFYSDGGARSTALVVLYAALYKPLFQFLVLSLIMGCVFKIESVYRGVLEWRGFTWTGRAAYSGFLVHTLLQRALVGTQLQPTHMTDYYVFIVLAATIFLGYLCAGILFVCVEAPAAALVKAALAHKKSQEN